MHMRHVLRFPSAMVEYGRRYKFHVPEAIVAHRIVGLGCDDFASDEVLSERDSVSEECGS
jgi:hypothetical protein